MSAVRFWLLLLAALLWTFLQTLHRVTKMIDHGRSWFIPAGEEGVLEGIMEAQRVCVEELKSQDGGDDFDRVRALRGEVVRWLGERFDRLASLREVKARFRGDGALLPRVLGLLVMEGVVAVVPSGPDESLVRLAPARVPEGGAL